MHLDGRLICCNYSQGPREIILWLKISYPQSKWALGPDLSGIQKIVGLLAAWLTAWLDGPGFLDPLKLPYKICGCVTQKMLI